MVDLRDKDVVFYWHSLLHLCNKAEKMTIEYVWSLSNSAGIDVLRGIERSHAG